MADVAIYVLMYMNGIVLHPYMGAALMVNLGTLVVSAVSIYSRRIFYQSLSMSVVTAVCIVFTLMTFYRFGNDLIFLIAVGNVSAMLVLWTAYATTIKQAPARWLHPFKVAIEASDAALA